MTVRTMAIADILKLPSVDSDAATGHGDGTWSIDNPLNDLDIGDPASQAIMAEMEYDGYNRVPIHVGYGRDMADPYNCIIPLSMLSTLFMGNGHHRLKMMILIGFTEARVTDDHCESDDTGDPQYQPDDDDAEYTGW
jgi:hypothetical protein